MESSNSDENDMNTGKPRKWTLKDVEIGRRLGSGRFGVVCLAREKTSRFVIALKIMYKSEFSATEMMTQIQREIEIQSNLIHPNIIRLYGYFYDRKRVYLMLEYAPRGVLSDDLERLTRFSDARAATYTYQLTTAVSYLHQNDIIHRDIKPDNILLGLRGESKLTDFGCAVHKPASRRTAKFGTLNYLAPEMIDPDTIHEYYVDIWSLGVLMYEMLCGCLPFDASTPEEIGRRIQFDRIEFPTDCPCSTVASQLISMMLQKEPRMRIALGDVKDTEWIQHNAEFSLLQCTAAMEDWKSQQTSSSVDTSASPQHSSDYSMPGSASIYF